jgi:hypothetical protein
MFFLRIVGALTAIAIGTGIVAYLFSGDRRYLQLAWRITRYALIMAFVVLALMFLERVAAII